MTRMPPPPPQQQRRRPGPNRQTGRCSSVTAGAAAAPIARRGSCRKVRVVCTTRDLNSSRCSSLTGVFTPAGITLPLEVFMSATKGWSVRVLSPVRKGEVSCLWCLAPLGTAHAQQPARAD
jgi:hypothetical protein